MTLLFTKMHGLGNDFMVIDATERPFTLNSEQIVRLSHRHTGVGFDQCLVVEKSSAPDVDFFYRIFNANGQEVGQCGNGARCLGRFVQARKLTNKKTICVQTVTTKMQLILHDDHTVTVQFAKPNLSPTVIPIQSHQQQVAYNLTINQNTYRFHAINVGNPHAILIIDTWEDIDVANIGQQLSTHPFFPEQINVGFLKIITPNHIQLRVYERGCGETLACGSGAVAAAAIGHLFHHMHPTIQVSLPGGDVHIDWPDQSGPIYLRGPASFVYEGSIQEEILCGS
jgi:diaminopimelate epimerase